jgi:dTDP-4-amino-4,6-dideoxygalactose transaminase
LKRLPALVARRRELAGRYRERLLHVPGVTTPAEPSWARTNWQSYAITLDSEIDQRVIMQRLLDDGVATRRGVMNVHGEAAYPPGSWREVGGLLQSERAQRSAVMLPLYHQMTDVEQDRVVAALARALSRPAAEP